MVRKQQLAERRFCSSLGVSCHMLSLAAQPARLGGSTWAGGTATSRALLPSTQQQRHVVIPQHPPGPGGIRTAAGPSLVRGNLFEARLLFPALFTPFWWVLMQMSPWPKELRCLLEAAFLPAESQASVALLEPNNWIYVSKDIKAWVKMGIECVYGAPYESNLLWVSESHLWKETESLLWKEVLTVTGIRALITMEIFLY